jgi:hypothetical protein
MIQNLAMRGVKSQLLLRPGSETPNFNYGVPHTLHPTPYTPFITATDQSGRGRSVWVQYRITLFVVVAHFLWCAAGSQTFALSTAVVLQCSPPVFLLRVLVWAPHLKINLADWVPRVLQVTC